MTERPLVAIRLEEESGVRIVGTPCDECGRPLRDSDPITWKAGEWGKVLFVAHEQCSKKEAE